MNELAELQIKDIEASVISDEERELAQNALFEFQSGAYTSCLKYLEKLESLRPKDLKVMHNKVVTEYYKNDLKKIIILRKSLNAICGQLSNLEASDAADDVEKCVMRYNQAILMYHTKQYYTALHIVSRLFSLIEPLGLYYILRQTSIRPNQTVFSQSSFFKFQKRVLPKKCLYFLLNYTSQQHNQTQP